VRSDRLYPNPVKTVALASRSTGFDKIQEARPWGKSFQRQGNTFVVTVIDSAISYGEIG
jgi:hypothetical protein